MDRTAYKPGDVLLDRFFASADDETRERAREAFREYAVHLVRVGDRVLREEDQVADSTELDRRPKIHPTPVEILPA